MWEGLGYCGFKILHLPHLHPHLVNRFHMPIRIVEPTFQSFVVNRRSHLHMYSVCIHSITRRLHIRMQAETMNNVDKGCVLKPKRLICGKAVYILFSSSNVDFDRASYIRVVWTKNDDRGNVQFTVPRNLIRSVSTES